MEDNKTYYTVESRIKGQDYGFSEDEYDNLNEALQHFNHLKTCSTNAPHTKQVKIITLCKYEWYNSIKDYMCDNVDEFETNTLI